MRWGHAQTTFMQLGLGPAQMSCPLASTDSTLLTCQDALRNTVKSSPRDPLGGRERTHHLSCGGKFPHHLVWREKMLSSLLDCLKTTVIGSQNPEPKLELSPRTQSKQYKQGLKLSRKQIQVSPRETTKQARTKYGQRDTD